MTDGWRVGGGVRLKDQMNSDTPFVLSSSSLHYPRCGSRVSFPGDEPLSDLTRPGTPSDLRGASQSPSIPSSADTQGPRGRDAILYLVPSVSRG